MSTRANGGKEFWGNVIADTFNGVELYQALLTQASTGAPVATVLRNDLDSPVTWGYSVSGVYTATCASQFLANKTMVQTGAVAGKIISVLTGSASVITVRTTDIDNLAANDILLATPIEIKVFTA